MTRFSLPLVLILLAAAAPASAQDITSPQPEPPAVATNPGAIRPDLRTPPYVPAPTPLPKTTPPPVFHATPSVMPAAPAASTPAVTGYGYGGMQSPPGAPPVGSYSPGGLAH